MSDAFLSYSSHDRALADRVAAGLAEHGLSVWYDEALSTGAAYRARIQAALDGASVVVVLWTAAAASSAWVKDEAESGRRRGVLFSVACGDVRLPADFRRTVFGRIKNVEIGPTPAELASLALGLRRMASLSQAAGDAPVGRLLARMSDFLATSIIFGVAIGLALAIAWRTSASLNSVGAAGICLGSTIGGLTLGAIAYASSRVLDRIAVRFFAVNAGPSVARLSSRWAGEALGVSLLVMLTMVGKKANFLDHPPAESTLYFVLGLVMSVLASGLALAPKYAVFVLCTRCRYFLLA